MSTSCGPTPLTFLRSHPWKHSRPWDVNSTFFLSVMDVRMGVKTTLCAYWDRYLNQVLVHSWRPFYHLIRQSVCKMLQTLHSLKILDVKGVNFTNGRTNENFWWRSRYVFRFEDLGTINQCGGKKSYNKNPRLLFLYFSHSKFAGPTNPALV